VILIIFNLMILFILGTCETICILLTMTGAISGGCFDYAEPPRIPPNPPTTPPNPPGGRPPTAPE
jgi:hypothetical protein